MTSKLSFSKIKHAIVKSSSEVTDTERSSGKLYARSIINRLAPGLRIEAFVLKTSSHVKVGNVFTVYEDDIRKDTRRCFQTLPTTYMEAGKLPVKTDFMKKIKDGDTILIILHKIL